MVSYIIQNLSPLTLFISLKFQPNQLRILSSSVSLCIQYICIYDADGVIFMLNGIELIVCPLFRNHKIYFKSAINLARKKGIQNTSDIYIYIYHI